MYSPSAADFDALVSLSGARGIDPHDVALTLYIESAGFDPASMGPQGDGAVSGLNQMSRANLTAYGMTPETWTALSAAAQLPTIFAFWDGLARGFSGGHFPPDAAHLTALNFVPAYYQSSGAAANPDAPLVSRASPDAAKAADYAANLFYDPNRTGAITVNTIAARQAMSKASGGARWAMLASGIDAALARVEPSPAPVAGSPSTVRQAGFGVLLFVAWAAVELLRRARA